MIFPLVPLIFHFAQQKSTGRARSLYACARGQCPLFARVIMRMVMALFSEEPHDLP